MAVAETLVLVAIGLLLGVLSTVFDVLVLGTASFLSHFSLWVLLNALLAAHIDDRKTAMWWSVPFNLGYIEGYFISTVASFESYAKSLMVPLAGVAVIAPFLSYALWTVRKERGGIYGQLLAVVVVVSTLAASYFLNGSVGIYDAVVCVLIGLVLLVVPAKRLRIERVSRAVSGDVAAPAASSASQEGVEERGSKRRLRLGVRRRSKKGEDKAHEVAPAGPSTPAPEPKATSRTLRPTKRAKTGGTKGQGKARASRSRRATRDADEREREQRRRAAAMRRAEREDSELPSQMATLGNARVARRSTRNA